MMITKDGNSNSKIEVQCSSCGAVKTIVKKEHTRNCRRQSEYADSYLCTKCYRNLNKLKNIESMKKAWSTDERKKIASASSNSFWESMNADERSKHSRKGITKERNKKVSEAIKKKFESEEYRNKQALARSRMPNISKLQKHLYLILDSLGIEYYKESEKTKIGFYVFDCLIPKQGDMKKDVLVECHGEYWHSLEKSKRNDKAKETFIERYHKDKYDFIVLWEYDFLFEKKITELIKSLCHICKYKQVSFDFADLNVKKCEYKEAVSFLSKFHYLHTIPRGSEYIGAYLNENLLAIFVASRPIRQNIAQTLFLNNNEVLEISRFCIHPSYQKKNFASWFMKRAMKFIKTKAFIAYADSTCGHNGTIYKASNFKLDRIVRPDYWYVDSDGYVMHKKTLYNRAIKMGKKESIYAFEHGFRKVKGKEKYRFVRMMNENSKN